MVVVVVVVVVDVDVVEVDGVEVEVELVGELSSAGWPMLPPLDARSLLALFCTTFTALRRTTATRPTPRAYSTIVTPRLVESDWSPSRCRNVRMATSPI